MSVSLLYVLLIVWFAVSIPFGLGVGAVIRGRRRRVVDLNAAAEPTKVAQHAPAPRFTAASEQLTDSA